MKTTIYITEGRQQLILTPGNDHEKNILKSIFDKPQTVSFKVGGFYACQGGWDRAELDNYIMVIEQKKEDGEAKDELNADAGLVEAIRFYEDWIADYPGGDPVVPLPGVVKYLKELKERVEK